MNFIIKKQKSSQDKHPTWRLFPTGDFYKTLLILKHTDLKDVLRQIIDEDPEIANYLWNLLKH